MLTSLLQRLLFLITLFIMVLCDAVRGQSIVNTYIDAWKTNDTSQTHRAEDSYDWLKTHRSPEFLPEHQELMHTLNQYLKRHPDNRLEIRAFMYDFLAKDRKSVV